jgi:hypothetical protein
MPTWPDSGMSELVRRRYFGRPIIANADAIMIKELRRLGGLLKHVHNESNGVNSKETAEALIALKAYIENLSDGRQKIKNPRSLPQKLPASADYWTTSLTQKTKMQTRNASILDQEIF